jgi:hypothetical protein
MTFWAFLGLLTVCGAGFFLKGAAGALLAALLFLPALLGKWGSY